MAILIAMAIGVIAGFLHFPWLAILLYPLLLIPGAAYKVEIINVTYRHSSIGAQPLFADMKTRSFAWLTFTNFLLLLVTFGIAWPWTKVRLARYRCKHLGLMTEPGALDRIAGETPPNQSAFAEEAAEFLDFDISL